MAVKDSIFGSGLEERGFRSMESTWGESYMLCSQLPMSVVFDPKSRDTSNFFFKTSLDYVLCTKEGRPLLAIDFDGMGKGFDEDGEYVQVEPTRDRDRKSKFDFKLKYAQDNNFPYHVVASEEFNFLSDEVTLTVADGIIGSIISNAAFLERGPLLLEEYAEKIGNQPFWYQSEYTQDLLTDLETECFLEHDPLVRKETEVRKQLLEMIDCIPRWGFRYFSPLKDSEVLPNYYEVKNNVASLGCVVTIYDTPVGEVSEIASVRNVAYSASIVREIAELLAWSKLLRLLLRGT